MLGNRTNIILYAAMIMLGLAIAVACNTTMNRRMPSRPILNSNAHPSTDRSPPPDVEEHAQGEPGRVSIVLSACSYKVGEVILATIVNRLEHAIYSEDLKSDCSIVILEELEADSWRPILGCNMERLPFVVAIGPGRGRTVRINPLSTHFGVTLGSKKPAFGAGRYRIKFTYRLEPGPEASEPNSVYSEPFQIEP